MPLPGKTSKMNPKGKLDKSKEESSRLEEENRLMEVRLQELKLAMDKEKKARSVQNQGGGFWQSAQENKQPTGPVNHPPEVLKKNMRQYEKPRARVRKVKVLKDEPLMLPSRPPAVTDDIKRIMTKELPRDSKLETSPKSKKCGQCEMKAAAVICQDCGENYCPGCFASFHLKGALKKHRSIPIQAALGARQSPRMPFLPKPPPVSYHEKEQEQGMKVVEKPAIVEPEPKVHFDGPSLLDGDYDEQANATEFAAALAQWRSGNGAGDETSANDSQSKSSKSSDSGDSAAKSVTFADQGTQSPRYTLDVKGTSTEEGSGKPVKIEFHQSELSYAEKLLLRKHRRDPVEAIPVRSPRSSESKAVDSSSEESLPDRSESVDFESLYHIAVPSPRPGLSQTSVTSQVEVVEVTSMTDVSSMEQATCYQVEEEPGCIEFVNQKNAKNDAKNGRDSKTPASKIKKVKHEPEVRKSSAKSEKSPVKSSRDSKIERKTPDLRKTWEKEPSLSMDKIPKVEAKKPPIPEAKKSVKEAKSKEVMKKESVDLTLDLQKEKSTVKKTSASPRPKSRSAATPRSARPNSRQARAALREALGEGALTKKPSSGLSAVAQRPASESESQYRGLGDILTLGVRPVQQDRIIVARTPRSAGGEKRPQSSVSYKLYSMGPKSWRPDSALGHAVADDQVTGHDFNLALADPGAEVDDDIDEEIKALDVIGGLRLSFTTNHDEANTINQSNERLSSSRDGVDQSQDLMHLRASVQSDSSCEEALQRLAEPDTPREKSDVTGRESRMIVVDGEDMTEYDQDKYLDAPDLNPGQDDTNTLNQLEWELASMTGRITAEGKISRLSLHSSQDSAVSSPGSSAISSPLDSAREIEMAVRNDGLGFDDLDTQIADELDVRALK